MSWCSSSCFAPAPSPPSWEAVEVVLDDHIERRRHGALEMFDAAGATIDAACFRTLRAIWGKSGARIVQRQDALASRQWRRRARSDTEREVDGSLGWQRSAGLPLERERRGAHGLG
jgi:hypothetical protein